MLVKIDKPFAEGWNAYGKRVWMQRGTIELRFTSIVPIDVNVTYRQEKGTLLFKDGNNDETFRIRIGYGGVSDEDVDVCELRIFPGQELEFFLEDDTGTVLNV